MSRYTAESPSRIAAFVRRLTLGRIGDCQLCEVVRVGDESPEHENPKIGPPADRVAADRRRSLLRTLDAY
jgi:hypothetical protein